MSDKKDEKEGRISETVKKIISVGVGAAFMTEDAVKGVLQDLPISKDILSGLVQNAKSTKEEFVNSLRDEVRSYLKNLDASVLLDNILERYDIDVQTTVKFKKKESSELAKSTEKKEVRSGKKKKA